MAEESLQAKGDYRELGTNWTSRLLDCHPLLKSEIEELVSLFHHQTLDSPKLNILHKNLKAARLAIADCVVVPIRSFWWPIRGKNNELNVLAFHTTVKEPAF